LRPTERRPLRGHACARLCALWYRLLCCMRLQPCMLIYCCVQTATQRRHFAELCSWRVLEHRRGDALAAILWPLKTWQEDVRVVMRERGASCAHLHRVISLQPSRAWLAASLPGRPKATSAMTLYYRVHAVARHSETPRITARDATDPLGSASPVRFGKVPTCGHQPELLDSAPATRPCHRQHAYQATLTPATPQRAARPGQAWAGAAPCSKNMGHPRSRSEHPGLHVAHPSSHMGHPSSHMGHPSS